MFIRFVVGGDADHYQSLTGMVTEARILRDNGHLDEYQTFRLKETYVWLSENLPVPPFNQLPRNVVCWFRDEAGEPVQRMWDIASRLKESGVPVRLLRSARPGKILYEDEYQIAVEEWQSL